MNAVEYSLNLAVHKNIIMKPYCVNMGIEIDNDLYEWSYRISGIEREELLFENQAEYYIQYEKLVKNNKIIYERQEDDIKVLRYDKVPQPKKDKWFEYVDFKCTRVADIKDVEKIIISCKVEKV